MYVQVYAKPQQWSIRKLPSSPGGRGGIHGASDQVVHHAIGGGGFPTRPRHVSFRQGHIDRNRSPTTGDIQWAPRAGARRRQRAVLRLVKKITTAPAWCWEEKRYWEELVLERLRRPACPRRRGADRRQRDARPTASQGVPYPPPPTASPPPAGSSPRTRPGRAPAPRTRPICRARPTLRSGRSAPPAGRPGRTPCRRWRWSRRP